MGTSSGRGLQPGDRIGRYEIRGALGRGAMGMVFRARDTVLGREVAIKVMVAHFTEDPDLRARFQREARVIARLKHPNIVVLHDIGYEDDGSPFLAMELLRGETLESVLRRQAPVSFDWKVSVVLQVLSGLAHAHQAGVVHRDIKPGNVFVTEDGTAKLMDFGVARVTTTSTLSASGSIVGTAEYMSPEQARGGLVDGRSDLFSMGSMLFELLARRKPFPSDSLMGTLYRIAHDEPDFAEVRGQPEGEAIVPILERAMRKPLAQRFQTAEEFAAALRQAFPAAATLPTVVPRPPGQPAAPDEDQAPTRDDATSDLRATGAMPAEPTRDVTGLERRTGPTVPLAADKSTLDAGAATRQDPRARPERRAAALRAAGLAGAGVLAVVIAVRVFQGPGPIGASPVPPTLAPTTVPPTPAPASPAVSPEPSAPIAARSPLVSPRPRASPRATDIAAVGPGVTIATPVPSPVPTPATPGPLPSADVTTPSAAPPTPAPAAIYDADRLPATATRPAPLPGNRMPEFPASERARGEKGPVIVYLHLTIDASGAVTAVDVVSGREPYRSLATEAARTWRFSPARVDGRDVAVRDFLVPVRFSVASR